jgi:hypothetical protein
MWCSERACFGAARISLGHTPVCRKVRVAALSKHSHACCSMGPSGLQPSRRAFNLRSVEAPAHLEFAVFTDAQLCVQADRGDTTECFLMLYRPAAA